MSNNLTRKALAFGSMVALGASALVGLPAQADANGPISLLPNGGTRDGATFTSLIGTPLTLDAALSANLQHPATTITIPDDGADNVFGTEDDTTSTVTTDPLVDPLADVYYIIENPEGANISVELSSTPSSPGFKVYDAAGDASSLYTDDTDFVDYEDGNSLTFTAEKIAVKATGSGSAGDRSIASLELAVVDSDEDTAVELEVTVLADWLTVDGKVTQGEYASATETVTFLNSTEVSVGTAMSATGTTRGAGGALVAGVSIGGGVNPYAVLDAGSLGVVFFQDGEDMDIAATGAIDVETADGAEYYASAQSYNSVEEDGLVFATTTQGATTLTSAVYSARAVYKPTEPDQFLGARSQVLDLRDGTNADVADIYASVTETDDLSDDSTVRSGTETVSATLQIVDDADEDLADAGVRVRVTVEATTLDDDSTVTVGGVTLADEEDTTYYAYTNSLGQVPVTLTNTGAVADDVVTLSYAVLKDNGLYETGEDHVFTWADADYATFVASPSDYLQGDTVNVTFTAVDQWGVGIDSTDLGRVSFKVEAVVDGVVDETVYSETEPTTNGSASFSFANFAEEGSSQELWVASYQGTTQGTPVYYTVYNNLVTSGIAISDAFETDVMYSDTVEGDAGEDSALDALAAATVDADNHVTIVGTVLDANNAGQPGAPVTISAAGVQFWDEVTDVYAVGSIEVYANAQGYFEVDAQTQTANASGQTVTITSGGVTETTLLKSYLPADLDVDNLKLSWTLPANIVKDTTYSVVATLTDVWGNPVRTVADADGEDTILFTADGALQVNGKDSVAKEFSSTGSTTVFVRSVADIAGPGSFTAALISGEDNIVYYTGDSTTTAATNGDAADTFEDDVNTSWDESAFAGALTTTVDVLETAPAVATGVVNVGSFNGKLVVYAKDLAGQKISWKVAGKWGVAYPTTSFERFDRPTGAVGVNVIVEIYVNGVKQLTKTVLTR